MTRGPADIPEVGRLEARRHDAGAHNVEIPERLFADDDLTAADDPAAANLAADLTHGLPRLPFAGAAIRRRIRFWCAAGLVGLVLGAALVHEHPPPYRASTSVLLTPGAGQNAADQMLTEVALVQSRTVAQAAMHQVGLPVTPKSLGTFIGDYVAAGQTDKVLQILV